jgi:cell division septation protein DedD
MAEERRQHQRLVPDAPLFVSLDDANSGLLLDLCEGGLAVASLVPRSLDEIVTLGFDLPERVGRFAAKARIAWTRDSGHLTGVHFIDLEETSRQQLSEWIATGTNLRLAPLAEGVEPVIVTRSTYAQVDAIRQEARVNGTTAERPLFDAPAGSEGDFESAKHEQSLLAGRERGGKIRYSIELFVAVVILSWALVFLGYQMGSTGASRQSRETAAPKVTEASSRPEQSLAVASAASLSAPTPTPKLAPVPASARTSNRAPAVPRVAAASLSAGPAMDSGIVLQVGAMKLEDNAAAMAQELRKKKFPAVVFRHGNEKLYRVVVGPYGDADSTVKVKQQLEKEGFKPLLQRWAKEAKE